MPSALVACSLAGDASGTWNVLLCSGIAAKRLPPCERTRGGGLASHLSGRRQYTSSDHAGSVVAFFEAFTKRQSTASTRLRDDAAFRNAISLSESYGAPPDCISAEHTRSCRHLAHPRSHRAHQLSPSHAQRGAAGAGARRWTFANQTIAPNNAPTPAVIAIARAPQKVTPRRPPVCRRRRPGQPPR